MADRRCCLFAPFAKKENNACAFFAQSVTLRKLVTEKRIHPLSWDWLTNIYTECGLDAAEAEASAKKTWRRLLTRIQRAQSSADEKKIDIRAAMIKDPMVSFHRITGTGMSGLPFYDDDTAMLNPVELTFAMTDAGQSAEVALAFAKVIVEMTSPEDFFTPIWNALGEIGPLDLGALKRMDWSPLRAGIDLSSREGGPIAQREKPKSHLNRPLLSDGTKAPVQRPKSK